MAGRDGARKRLPSSALAAVGVALAVAVVAAAVVLGGNDGGGDGSDGGSMPSKPSMPSMPSMPSTPSTPSTTTPDVTSTTSAPEVAAAAVWPFTSSATRFSDPREAARSFAVDYAGFVNPAVGPFQAGDSRSGEVEIRSVTGGVPTTVAVRQLGADGSWWVLGAATGDILVDRPVAGSEIVSPLRLEGRARAFEGTVSVEVRRNGSLVPLGTSFVTGSGSSQLGPFSGDVSFGAPAAATRGAVVFRSPSAEDGRTLQAAVLAVTIRPAPVPPLPASCRAAPSPAPSPAQGQMVVTVFFTCDRGGGGGGVPNPVAASRVVPASTGVLRASLEALVAGPTAADQAAGLSSFFSAATAGALRSVSLGPDGAATVDFADLRPIIPNAGTSTGTAILLSELDATVFQFPTVRSVRYQINGSCAAFFEWLQLACETRTR